MASDKLTIWIQMKYSSFEGPKLYFFKWLKKEIISLFPVFVSFQLVLSGNKNDFTNLIFPLSFVFGPSWSSWSSSSLWFFCKEEWSSLAPIPGVSYIFHKYFPHNQSFASSSSFSPHLYLSTTSHTYRNDQYHHQHQDVKKQFVLENVVLFSAMTDCSSWKPHS